MSTIYATLDSTSPLPHVCVTQQDYHAMKQYYPLLKLVEAVVKVETDYSGPIDNGGYHPPAIKALAQWIKDNETPEVK